MSKPIPPLILAAALVLATANEASAYTDPGSGALLLQIIAGAAVGCLFYVRRIFGWFAGKRKTAPK